MIQLEKYIAGQYENSLKGYDFFVPSKINDEWNWNNQQVNALLEKAALKLGELNSFAKLVPNVDLFIQLQVTAEAVVSSRIEGTQTNINEALLSETDIAPERRDDWKEVRNYIDALNQAIKELEKLPISSRLIKKTHKALLNSVRGEHKQPGEYRRSQNWIGGTTPDDAVFVPPHDKYINELMGDLENFLHNDKISVPFLIRIAIAHYQFETIHPFLDGNGRIGRLLITLFLVDQKIQSKPLLYLSAYFESHKGLYYDNLTFVRTKNDMTQWIKYFLTGIVSTSENAINTLIQVLSLKEKTEIKINKEFGRKANSANILLLHLLQKPIVEVKEVQQATGLSFKAANNLVADFVQHEILEEITGQSRNRFFVFDHYLKLFKG